MTWGEIQGMMISGCDYYLEFLRSDESRKNGKGWIKCSVKKIRPFADAEPKNADKEIFYALQIEESRHNSTLGFAVFIEDRQLNAESQYRIVSANKDTKEVIVGFNRNLIHIYPKIFRDCDASGLTVGVDLTWLIENVRYFYDQQETALKLPVKCPIGYSWKNCLPIQYSKDQEKAVESAMMSPISYVWGAPGTGKTKVILTSCVIEYLRRTNANPILIVAPTNNAIDLVMGQIIDSVASEDRNKILRYGHPTAAFRAKYPNNCAGDIDPIKKNLADKINRTKEQIVQTESEKKGKDSKLHDLDNSVVAKMKCKIKGENIDLLKNSLRSDILRLEREIVSLKQGLNECIKELHRIEGAYILVKGCTIDHYISSVESFNDVIHIFADEAAYISLAKGMTLLKYGVPITMFGDHKQLKPVCELDDRKIDQTNACIWAISMLHIERIFNESKERMMKIDECDSNLSFRHISLLPLISSYRYSQDIASILDKWVYDNIGIRGLSVTTSLYREIVISQGYSNMRRSSIEEVLSIKRIMSIIDTKDTIILTPYKRQLDLLKQHISEVPISTIHSAQGREFSTVILSLADPLSDAYFTSSTNDIGKVCLNTAISRTKDRIIIVCDSSWLRAKDQMVGDLLNVSKSIYE